MNSVSSTSTSQTLEQNSVSPATMKILAAGEGVRLVAMSLWGSQISQMSVCEVYEWLAEKYPQYQYTKKKIRSVLEHDSKRHNPRFMIANQHRLAGVPYRWAIRPEMELELRRLCGGPENFWKGSFYTKAAITLRRGTEELGRVKIDGDSMHNLLPRSTADKLGLYLYSGDTIRIRLGIHSILISQYCRFAIRVAGVETTIDTYVVSELPSLLLGMAWIKEARLLKDVANHIYYIRGPLGNLFQLPNPTSTIEVDTDSATGEREAALAVAEELPTATEAGECEPGKLTSTSESSDSAAGDETISEEEVWKDAVPRQSTRDELYSVDRILAEKQQDGVTHYLLLWDGYTEDQSTWEPLQNIRGKELLDIWRERKAQELRGMAPAFNLVNFERRRRERLGLTLRERRSKLQMKRTVDSCDANHTSHITKKLRTTSFPGRVR